MVLLTPCWVGWLRSDRWPRRKSTRDNGEQRPTARTLLKSLCGGGTREGRFSSHGTAWGWFPAWREGERSGKPITSPAAQAASGVRWSQQPSFLNSPQARFSGSLFLRISESNAAFSQTISSLFFPAEIQRGKEGGSTGWSSDSFN